MLNENIIVILMLLVVFGFAACALEHQNEGSVSETVQMTLDLSE